MGSTVLFQLDFRFIYSTFRKKFQFQLNKLFPNGLLGCVWHWLKKLVFFYYLAYFATIQLIFASIHKPHCTFWYYLWVSLYYFNYLLTLSIILSVKSFQF